MDLTKRLILITGGSSGIGKAVARHCLAAGASVIICSRDANSLERARAELEPGATGTQQIITRSLDVSRPAEVERVLDSLQDQLGSLSGLVNAAGVLGPKGSLDEVDMTEWVTTIQVNLIGTVLMCRGVLPYFREQRYGKIINFSGGGATSPRPRFSAYAASKTAVVRFTENLAEELKDTGIFVNAIAPGAVNTRMLEEVLAAGPEKVGQRAYEEALKQTQLGGTSPDRAGALCAMLLSSEGDGITGRLISAVWDAWELLPERKDALSRSDVYTLRRIVPVDRGLKWE